jgi:hypothetical protein
MYQQNAAPSSFLIKKIQAESVLGVQCQQVKQATNEISS